MVFGAGGSRNHACAWKVWPAVPGAPSAVGVALHTVLETGMLGKPIEASWFAIIIGLLTGLGVRQANRTHMERSYLRGAVSGVIALAAIYGSTVVIAEIMKKRDQSMASKPTAVAADEADDARERFHAFSRVCGRSDRLPD